MWWTLPRPPPRPRPPPPLPPPLPPPPPPNPQDRAEVYDDWETGHQVCSPARGGGGGGGRGGGSALGVAGCWGGQDGGRERRERGKERGEERTGQERKSQRELLISASLLSKQNKHSFSSQDGESTSVKAHLFRNAVSPYWNSAICHHTNRWITKLGPQATAEKS